MPARDPETLKAYLEMITADSGGIEGALARLTPQTEAVGGGLENMSGGQDRMRQAQEGLETIARDQAPTPEQMYGLEAIILPGFRPAEPIVDGTFKFTQEQWAKLSDDAATRTRLEGVIPSIGRIELPGNPNYPYGGTGFVVGDNLIMTNRHVAAIFASGLGDRRLDFLPDARAGIDFKRELDRPTGPTLMVDKIVLIHPFWDMAILRVDRLPASARPLKLSLQDARDLAKREIVVIGYPASDTGRNPAAVQNQVFGSDLQIKRIQPGLLQGGLSTGSFGKSVRAASHDCSTLGGNSGSALVDVASGEVLGLHFGGLYLQQNYAVPASELARDSRVIATGVQFAGKATGGDGDWAAWWRQADAMEAAQGDADTASSSPATPAPPPPANTGGGVTTMAPDGSVTFEIPLRITISLGAVPVVAATAQATRPETVAAETEALREPDHADADVSRSGYDPDFLNQTPPLAGLTVPLPGAADAAILARSRTGADVLHYQNFSIRMHASRRLALVTASNVTKEFALRQPEPGRDYSRKGLSGLGPNDQEKWFLDPNLGPELQLPDIFFTKDKGAFDKGHIVRREDVAWGKSYAALKLANGDTYHVTNCSPQVAGFNRSTLGVDNWGDLENVVLSQAASERLCVFAGPVLADDDETFVGRGDSGVVLRAKVPSRFWKVIVARVGEGLAAFGFMLEQDLSAVPTEFVVPASFKRKLQALTAIETATGVSFATALHAADQYETELGAEIARRGGAG